MYVTFVGDLFFAAYYCTHELASWYSNKSFIHKFSYLYLICLQAFDQHLNMVLGDVEEAVTTREIDEETEEEIVKVANTYINE